MPEFEGESFNGTAWRAVEGQHLAATMLLVDTLDEQRLLEDIIEAGKPAVPAAAAGLHYLLATPFRYPPTAHGSRFRDRIDPGVFYGAQQIRTACAELGYWRWRFLTDSPSLAALPPNGQTLFRVSLAGGAIDLRVPLFVADRASWTHPTDYAATQRLAAEARRRGIALIRYQSVRDPERGEALAVLHPAAFAAPEPIEREIWYLGVNRERVRWIRDQGHGPDAMFEFSMTRWVDPA